MGHNAGGFSISSSSNIELPPHLSDLPPFSSLSWVDRQLVREWRTYLPETPQGATENEDFDFEQARTLVPNQIPRPRWQKAEMCHSCHKPFGPVRLRHHCRSCGRSFCQDHSLSVQRLPHLGYDDDVPERVCDSCKRMLEDQNLAERVTWRLARCRDHGQARLAPYFETGIDSAQDVALRLTKAAIAMAKSIPLGAQATVAVDTVDVLRKYGLHGIYGIMLRQEFLAAADLLRKALGINKFSWPLSVHELSAAIFYALAQHRAMRGLSPEREHTIHQFRPPPSACRASAKEMPSSTKGEPAIPAPNTIDDTIVALESSSLATNNDPLVVDSYELSALDFQNSPAVDETDTYNPVFSNYVKLDEKLQNPVYHDPRRCALNSTEGGERQNAERKQQQQQQHNHALPKFTPVCDPVPDTVLGSIVFYAPIALNFIYATKEVEMQLLAGQQGWRLLYAYLNQDTDSLKPCDRPASAIFVHQEHKIACLSIRGTATIHDVITDIRQTPVSFPNVDFEHGSSESEDGDWTNVDRSQGLALCGMASAAYNLFSEHIDTLLYFVKQGYRIRLVGHSLGGGVATMTGVLVLKYLEQLGYSNLTDGSTLEDITLLKVYAYGTPSCFDAKLANSVDSFVTTVVLHDDVFPRLTPTSCRGLLKHLLYIRETWVEAHIEEDLRAVGERAKTVWAPRFRQNFALRSSTKSIKKYCKKQILRGKSKLMPAKVNAMNRPSNETTDEYSDCVETESLASDASDWGEKFFVPTTNASMISSYDETDRDAKFSDTKESHDSQAQLLLEFLGAGDNQREGIIIDGDEFFEPEENLVADGVDGSESVGDECFGDPIGELAADETSQQMNDSWSLDMHGNGSPPQTNQPSTENDDENDPAAVILDESPLPRMFLPGKVIHIYSHRGVYKAAYVPRTFKELRRISLAGNMLSNHTAKSYFESLLEVQTVRSAPESPPIWTAYDEDNTCCCCANRFTWASTSNSEAQEARDKHNCRSCGGLICDPCSKNRVPIPSIGLTVPVRVCDRCYNDFMGGVSAASPAMTSSVFATGKDGKSICSYSATVLPEEANKKPERMRQKRSVVVDDLVSKICSSALT
uniref:sn-1-specific diacylglycerol lipase n=1 Tax=Pseudo-nitzschia australis TaxID=44445 RepID=A0A7S4EI62_9STRA